MRLICPSCKHAVLGADIDLQRGVGICRPCGEIVPLGGPDAALAVRTPSALANVSPRYRPNDFTLIELSEANSFVATVPPNRLKALPLVGFAVFWNGFMLVWNGIALGSGAWFMSVFSILHVSVGVLVAYKALVGLFNAHRISMENGRFLAKNGPIPASGKLDVPLANVDSFSTEQKVVENRRSTSIEHKVVANLSSGVSHPIALGTLSSASAEYVVDRLNTELARIKQGEHGSAYRD
jgi:hypothetical protein